MTSRADGAGRATALAALSLALFAQVLSGAAAIVNQTAWQRALIVHVAGSEVTSSLVVVLVFMAGLGAGSLWTSRAARRIANPARALAAVELLLGAANLLILLALALDPGENMRRFQRLVLSFGVPLPLLCAGVSAAVLLGPCFLMGVTAPLISETAQRQLRVRDNRFLVVLFFANTFGSFAGGMLTGFLLMPLLGQRRSLAIAILLNALAGVLLLAVAHAVAPQAAVEPAGPAAPTAARERRRLDAFAFFVGLLALAFEMYLYRTVALTFEPKPFTFATVLCFYLLFWSLGVLLARWARWPLGASLLATAAAALLPPVLAGWDWHQLLGSPRVLGALGFWLPCLGFGVVFGQLVTRAAVEWGRDVGRFYGWNTVGSCAGIVLGVLVGYRVAPPQMAAAISLGYLGLALAAGARERPGERSRRVFGVAAAATAGLVLSVLVMARSDGALARASGGRTYYGPEGVVEVRGRAVFWNGLGHSSLARGGDQVGAENWLLAALPLLAHAPGRDLDALVVGLGGGITAATLARSSAVRSVDVYEINPGLKGLLADYPEGTLGVGKNPKVRILWRDGRTGLALAPRQYDVVTQQPLYLKQAGSSLLLSREYLQLVRARLRPGGVFAIYSNSQQHAGQALLVRQTASRVFRYTESARGSYMVIASDQPFSLDGASIERVLAAAAPGDPFVAEARRLGVPALAAFLDRPRLVWDGSPLEVTDDHPIVEYPELADRMVAPRPRRAGR
jgi:spermidine synthase